MKISWEERFSKQMRVFGKRNKLCGVCAVCVRAVGLACIRAAAYFRGNGKRFAMVAVTFLLCVIYSSFSFPGFTSDSQYGLNPISDEARNITFSEEADIDYDELGRLDAEGWFPEENYGEEYDGREVTADPGAAQSQGQSGHVGSDEAAGGDTHQFSADDWRLTLVSPQHFISEDYEVVLGNISTIKGIKQCDERIIDDWLAMQQAAREDGVRLVICSTYRDEEYQEKLFNQSLTQYINRGLSYLEAYQRSSQYTNVPNGSEHQIGLALDIVTPTFLDLVEGFEETPAGKWLAANCQKYGFILRYPKGKEFITGVEYEPWHFRYVGVEAAEIIMEEGLTLEEFWEEYL